MKLVRVGRHLVDMLQVLYFRDGTAEGDPFVEIKFKDGSMLICSGADADAAREVVKAYPDS